MAGQTGLIVSVSGIRGIIGQGLSPEVAMRFARALAVHLGGGSVLVCRDGRPSGEVLHRAVVAGLTASGCDVGDLGVAPTPTCGFAVRSLGAAGGIQITASHNPAMWNGLKLFGADGRVLPAAEGLRVKELFESGASREVEWDRLGSVGDAGAALAAHNERVLSLVDVSAIRARAFSVLLDANGGSGGPLGLGLLDRLGCRVAAVGCAADGVFAHEPEPVAANLAGVCPRVVEVGAAAGLVLDPDADRLALIDEQGRYIGEELTLALAAWFRLTQQPGPVVVNMSTSRVTEDVARRFGAACHRSAVGEANVVDRMQREGAVIGGEGNGGVIDPRVGWVRDPLIGAGLILNLMAATGKKLSELVAELPAYTIVKEKYTLEPGRLPALYAAMATRWPEARADRIDGLRLDWDDRWLHVRPSNTEPIVRAIAEAPRAADAEGLCREVGELIGG